MLFVWLVLVLLSTPGTDVATNPHSHPLVITLLFQFFFPPGFKLQPCDRLYTLKFVVDPHIPFNKRILFYQIHIQATFSLLRFNPNRHQQFVLSFKSIYLICLRWAIFLLEIKWFSATQGVSCILRDPEVRSDVHKGLSIASIIRHINSNLYLQYVF